MKEKVRKFLEVLVAAPVSVVSAPSVEQEKHGQVTGLFLS